MSDQQESPNEPGGGAAALETHSRATRFHLGLHAAFAVACAAVLKVTGPYYADGIVAGLFGVGFFVALLSLSMLRQSASHAGAPAGAIRGAFTAFAAYYLASAFFIVWLSFVNPVEPEPTEEEGAVASELYLPAGVLLKIRS